jgi:hypothetical protein
MDGVVGYFKRCDGIAGIGDIAYFNGYKHTYCTGELNSSSYDQCTTLESNWKPCTKLDLLLIGVE